MGSKITSKMNAESLYRDIMAYIKEATRLMKNGDYIELVGLEDQVTKMCQIVQGLSIEESMSMRDDLDRMMQDLDALQALFMESRDRIAKELGSVGKHRQAALAYKQSENTSIRAALALGNLHESDKEQ